MSVPPVLLPYQSRWIEDGSKFKIIEKSRRTGLTWAEAADAVLVAAAAKKAGGRNHSYIGSGKEMAREFIDACADWARAFGKAASEVGEEVFVDEGRDNREITVFRINFASGFHIQALSTNPSNLRGRKGNLTIDEAGFQPGLLEVIKAAGALTMWGGKIRVISTHNGVDSEFNGLLSDARAGRNDYAVHRVTLEEACEQGLYRRICEVTGEEEFSPAGERAWRESLRRNSGTPEAAAEEYDCVPLLGGGAYLPRGLIDAAMREPGPVLRFRGSAAFNAAPEASRSAEMAEWCEAELRPALEGLDPKRGHCLGEDFGRTADLTVLAPLEIGERLQRRAPFLVELHNVPFRNQEQVLYYVGDRLPRLRGIRLDARGNGQYLAEQAVYRWGGLAEAVMPSQPWYLEIMPKLRAGFEDGALSIPRDDDVASDLRALQMVKGIPKVPDVRTGEKRDRHGDAAIALAMAWEASLRDAPEYAFESVPRWPAGRRDGWDDDDLPARGGSFSADYGRDGGLVW